MRNKKKNLTLRIDSKLMNEIWQKSWHD